MRRESGGGASGRAHRPVRVPRHGGAGASMAAGEPGQQASAAGRVGSMIPVG
jgi:hypothetical protein